MSDKQTAAMLDKKLDEKTAHTAFRDVTDMEPVEDEDDELPF